MSNKNLGEWKCPQCNFLNYKGRDECFKCDTEKPAHVPAVQVNIPRPKPAQHQSVLPGDWNCSQCKVLNFKNRVACFKCSTPKTSSYGGHNQQQQQHIGEWNCPKCNILNFKARNECFKCTTARPVSSVTINKTIGSDGSVTTTTTITTTSAAAAPADVVEGDHYVIDPKEPQNCSWKSLNSLALWSLVRFGKPRDWICDDCDNHNYANRTECKQCGVAQTDQSTKNYDEIQSLFGWMRKVNKGDLLPTSDE
jgi:hypothetical protein